MSEELKAAVSEEAPAVKLKKKFRLRKRYKVLFSIAAVLAVVEVGVLLATPYIDNIVPYRVTFGDKTIAIVKNKAAARDAILLAADSFTEDDETVKTISSDGKLAISRASVFKAISNTVSPSEASEEIVALTDEADDPLVMTVAATGTEQEKFTPDPILKKDKTMLAGEMRTARKSKKGLRDVTTTEVITGDDIDDATVTKIKTLKEGRKAVIYKGILGLPEGEDWKTYDGDPVYQDGDALATTGTQYLGAPYKLGGQNLQTGVSCLGFVKAIYAKYGIVLPMSHPGMKSSGIGVSYANAKRGDIICYKSHVGIYLGNGKMVDATSHGGVSIRGVSTKKLVTVRRIIKK